MNANALEEAPDYARQNRAIGADLRARLDLQGVHGRRGAGGRQGDARHDVQPAADPQGRRPRDQGRRGARLRDESVSDILKFSSNIGAVLIAQRVETPPFDAWIPVGLRQADRRRPAGRGAGLVLPLKDYSGATWATCRSARASRSRRCRWPRATPRSPTAASCARRTSSRPSAARRPSSRRATASSPRPPPPRVRKMLEGVLGPGGTASGAEIKGYTLAGKTGTAEKAINGTYSKDKYVASFIGFAPAKRAEAARRGDGRRAQRPDLRRPGRRAGVEGDRELLPRPPQDRPD